MKSIRRIIMIGTMAFAITLSSGMWSNNASADLVMSIDDLETQKLLHTERSKSEKNLYEMLGLESEEELHDALYNQQSLAEIAENRDVDVERIIVLQSSQLMEQIDERLAKGNLTLHEYSALVSEIPEIIRKSVYGE